MEVSAVTKYVRLAPSKAHDFARSLQGLKVDEALSLTAASRRKAAVYLGKTLRSAVANAVNNAGLLEDRLHVKRAVVEQGPTLRRHWPRARGMVSPIRRPTAHIRVTVSDDR